MAATEPVTADVGDYTYVALAAPAAEEPVAVVYRRDRYQSSSPDKEPLPVEEFGQPVVSELVRRLGVRIGKSLRTPASDHEHRHYFERHA